MDRHKQKETGLHLRLRPPPENKAAAVGMACRGSQTPGPVTPWGRACTISTPSEPLTI